MSLRLALCIGMAVAVVSLAAPLRSWADSPPPAPTAGTLQGTPQGTPPGAPQGMPQGMPQGLPQGVPPAQPGPPTPIAPNNTTPTDQFGEEITLTAQPIVYLKGTGTWDNAFATITDAFKTLRAYADKEGIKANGPEMTIFTATDDTGFQFEAAVPIAAPPTNPPQAGIAAGMSPTGRALKFVHRGSYDGLDNTYEAITNYLDEKRLDARDMFIEQYVTDPVTSNPDHLVVNVLVLIK